MDDNEYWIKLWGMILGTILAIVLIVGMYNLTWHSKYSTALRDSSNPIALRCALDMPLSSSNTAQYEVCLRAMGVRN